MAKKFESKVIDLTIEIVGSSGEVKTFETGERVTADFAKKVGQKIQKYIEANNEKETKDQDSQQELVAKQLCFVYPTLDKKWIMQNCVHEEMKDILNYVGHQLIGLKKESKS